VTKYLSLIESYFVHRLYFILVII